MPLKENFELLSNQHETFIQKIVDISVMAKRHNRIAQKVILILALLLLLVSFLSLMLKFFGTLSFSIKNEVKVQTANILY